MNEKHAQYMLTVLQEGNITNAAKKLYISQPSLSQMIKLVESNLGTPIFNRNTEPITLTFAGQKYIEAAKQILTINANLQKEIDEINHEDHGTIKLGIPVQRGMQVIPYILPKFKQMYPHVKLEVIEHGSGTIESLVREGAVDMACLTTNPKYEELQYILVEEEELVLLTGKGSKLSKQIRPGSMIEITDAKDEEFVSIKSGHSIRNIQDRLFVQYDIKPKIILETSSIEVAKRTAIACNAVMICPLNYITMSPDLLPNCITFPIASIKNDRNFYICHRKDLYLTKYMKDFITLMTSEEKPFITNISQK